MAVGFDGLDGGPLSFFLAAPAAVRGASSGPHRPSTVPDAQRYRPGFNWPCSRVGVIPLSLALAATALGRSGIGAQRRGGNSGHAPGHITSAAADCAYGLAPSWIRWAAPRGRSSRLVAEKSLDPIEIAIKAAYALESLLHDDRRVEGIARHDLRIRVQ